MADPLWGFSPRNAAMQVGNALNPTTPRSDYDIFTTARHQQSSNRNSYSPSPTSDSVYWIGQDGNVYVDGQNMGRDLGGGHAGAYTAANRSGIARYIDDPNPGGGGGGADPGAFLGDASQAPGGGGTGQRLNQVGINAANAQLGTLDAELARALAAEEQDYQNTRAGYDAEAGERLRQRDEGVTRNTQNYDSNLMASLRAGSRGIGGLMQILRGSAGTAVERARGAVADTTADDIRAGYDTNRENTEAITGAYNTFATSDKLRRDQLEDQYANNRMAAEAQKFSRQQQLLNDLAGYYSQAGMDAQANDFSSRAVGLQPELSARSARQVSKITPQQASWQAPEITAFSGASAPEVITPTEQGRIGAGVFTLGDERRRREVPVGV